MYDYGNTGNGVFCCGRGVWEVWGLAGGGWRLSIVIGGWEVWYGRGDGVDVIGSSRRQESWDLKDLVDDGRCYHLTIHGTFTRMA